MPQCCDAAVTHVGALGPTALERAPVAHLEPGLLGMLPYEKLRVSGLCGWVVAAHLDEQTPPCDKPFAHLADIEELRGKLRSALGG